MMRIFLAALLTAASLFADLVQDVRSSIAQNDFAMGEQFIDGYQKQQGVTPESILAL